MRKNMKKLVSLMLAMVMIFAMSVTVFANETVDPAPTTAKKDTTVVLTIDKAETGHTYKIYQLLTGDVSELANGSGVLANVGEGSNLSGTVAEFDAAIKDTDGKYLTGTALSAAASAKIDTTKDPYATIIGAGEVATQNVTPGYYIVKDCYTDPTEKVPEGGSPTQLAAYMVAVVGNTTMKPKTSLPDIDKNITDEDANAALEGATATSKKTDTAAIGDVINYESNSTVPVTEGYKYYYYVVSDTMSEGLTYNRDLEIKIGEGNTAVTLVKDTDYTITETDRGFELVIKDMKNISETQGLAGKAITITYSATVNDNAKIGTEPNTNTIKLTYSNNPSDTFNKDKSNDNKPKPGDATGVTPEHITKTYVTEVAIKKVDQDGKPLTGAEFTLTGTNLNKVIISTSTEFVRVAEGKEGTGKYYKLNDGTYTNEAPQTDDTKDGYNADKYAETVPNYNVVTKTTSTSTGTEDKKVTATVDEKGMIVFTGLNAGEYVLKETKTPTGYTTADDIKFEIIVTQVGETTATEGTAIVWSDNNTGVVDANGVYEITVKNVKGNLLPSTGGIGTTIFYVLGTILMLGAGVILVAKRRVAR